MSKKPNRSFDNDKKSDGKVKSLTKALKEKEKHIRQLQSELATLESAFKKAANYMSKESAELSVEELIKASNKNATLEEAKKSSQCFSSPKKGQIKSKPVPPTLEEIQKKREEARESALKWRRENLGEYEEE